MFYKKICGFAAGLLLFCGVASAQGYGGVNLAFLTYAEDDSVVDGITVSADDASLTAFYGRLGYQVSENFSLEGRLGLGVGDDTVDITLTDSNGNSAIVDGELELKHLIGAYIRVGAPTSNAFYPYAIAGITQVKLDATVGAVTVSDSESDFSFGVGADFGDADSGGFNIEYMNYYDDDGASVKGFSIGYVSRF